MEYCSLNGMISLDVRTIRQVVYDVVRIGFWSKDNHDDGTQMDYQSNSIVK